MIGSAIVTVDFDAVSSVTEGMKSVIRTEEAIVLAVRLNNIRLAMLSDIVAQIHSI